MDASATELTATEIVNWLNSPWIASAICFAVISAIALFSKKYFIAKIEKSVQYGFDLKLEEVRTQFREKEAILKAELQSKGEQIATLRGGVLSELANRHAVLDKRRVEAIDKLWGLVVDSADMKRAVLLIQNIKMEKFLDSCEDQGEDGQKIKKFADFIWKIANTERVESIRLPLKERPFIPPIVWSLYVAYMVSLQYSLLQVASVRSGIGGKYLADPKITLDLVKSTLPHHVDFIDQHGTGSLPFLVGELEEVLFQGIQRSLYNPDADQESLKQLASLLKAADRVMETLENSASIPEEIST